MKKITLGLVIFLLLNTEGYGMSLLDIGKVCLFSGVKGKVLLNGKPVSNASVKQIYIWQQKTNEITVQTDSEGKFEFDAVYARSLSKFFPVEASIVQGIIINNENADYQGWRSVKRNFDENGELNGQHISLTCELSDTPQSKEVGLNLIRGICRWD